MPKEILSGQGEKSGEVDGNKSEVKKEFRGEKNAF